MDSVVLKAVLLMAFLCTISAQNRPPSIVLSAGKEVYFLDSQNIVNLSCVASGTPPPKITWYINLQPVNLNNLNTQFIDGTLNMQQTQEGFYQCSATNAFGTAKSNTSWVRMLRTTSAVTQQTNRVASVGQSLSLPCSLALTQLIVPSVNYKWQIVSSITSNDPRDIVLDQRIQMSDNGTLAFAYVIADDQQNGAFYRCHLTNSQNNILETSVAFTTIQVNSTGQVAQTQLTNLFSYSWPSIALERESVTLRCFFGGATDIAVSWKKQDVSLSTGGRFTVVRSSLLITNVQKSDEGVYTCTGSSAIGIASATVNLQTQSAPYFASIYDGPRDVNVTIGQDVVVNCNAYANPEASISWLLNGVPFDSSNLKPKFKLSSDKKTLTISNVCKSCADGTVANSDLMVIQCNASNANGYVFPNGYINVLDRTEITTPPANVLLNFPNTVIFTCEAQTDVATQVMYLWTKDGQPQLNGALNSSIRGTLYIDISNDQSKGVDFTGLWTCNATNGVSSDSRSASLQQSSIGVLTAGVSWWWWIPLLVILLFLLAIALILLICCCLHRNRGEAYPVDEEERKGGNDPVKELQEIGFHDFQRPVDAPDGVILQTPLERTRRGPGSISSSVDKAASDDEMSLDNYSNINHGKFTEDGSFIGQYNPNRRKIQMTQPGIPESSA